MPNFDDILAIKKRAQSRLLSLPGVHAVAIGSKVVGTERTAELAITVFTVKKKDPSELSPEEMIPSHIEGIRTDVVEEEMPQLFASFPDEEQYSIMTGGIQLQAGTSVTGLGTLGCIARTDEPTPKIVALTCQHVVAEWSAVTVGIQTWQSSSDQTRTLLYGPNIAGSQIASFVSLVQGTTVTGVAIAPYVTTAADTLATIGSAVAAAITAAGNPNLTGTSQVLDNGVSVTANATGGFTARLTVQASSLWSTINGPATVATFQGHVSPGLIVIVDLQIAPAGGKTITLDFFHVTVAGDTLTSIASHLAGLINASGQGVTAAGPVLPTGSEITVTSGATGTATISRAASYVQNLVDPDSKLKAAISGNAITLIGRTDGDQYGLYTNVNPGGGPPSSGIFLKVPNKADLTRVAQSISDQLNAQSISGITCSVAGSVVTINGAEEAECAISSDVRVGQPVNSFGSSCSHCCNKRIGTVYDARLQIDTALIQLDPGIKYTAEIKDIGAIAGDHSVQDSEAMPTGTYFVQKRGRTTGPTTGTIAYLHRDGDIGSPEFHRRYTEAMSISSGTGPVFSKPGDSGSAVLNSAREVVGLLFGGSATISLATPIQQITSAFNLIIETATALNDVKVVPGVAPHVIAMADGATPRAIAAPRVNRLGINLQKLHEAEIELTATPAGNTLATSLRKHIPETQRLINTNRRFAGMWQANGGPEIVQSILRMPQYQDRPLPEFIEGRPLAERVQSIRKLLVRYASPELVRDLQRFEGLLDRLSNLAYSDLLITLRTLEVE